MAPQRVVALGKEEDVVGHRLEAPSAQGAGVRGGLEVLRAAELPPARVGHFVVVVPVVVVGAGGTGQEKPVRDLSTRQLEKLTFAPFLPRAR